MTTQTVEATAKRWWLVGGALLLQFSIGAVYAWSVFAAALGEAEPFQLSGLEAQLPFQVAIGMIFVGTFIGGRIQDKRGPRIVALIGGIIYAVGIILSSFAGSREDLWLLVLGYGVISGFGLGFAYIVPIAMLQKWFPDKTGLITGLAVGGFGFGAVATSPVAQTLISNNPDRPTSAFLPLGIAYLVMSLIGASIFRNPPEGYVVPGFTPAQSAGGTEAKTAHSYNPKEALRTPQWYLLTAILALNVTIGIALIGQAAAMAVDVAGYTVIGAATVVGVLAVFNGGGRIVWAWASDKIGRMPAFALMLGLAGVALLILPHAGNVVLWFVLAAIIYLCYGGGFGTMPATAGDYFGVKHAGAIYGLMLVAWSFGGVVGPLLASWLVGPEGNYVLAYTVLGIVGVAAVGLTVITKLPKDRQVAKSGA